MPIKTLDIQFPAAGVVRRTGVRTATRGGGPFATPWSMNVRLEDSLTNRLRGGSFTPQSASTAATWEYRDRTFVMSNNEIQVSEQGNAANFDYSKHADNPGRATVYQLSKAGETGENVVSLAPFEDAYLLGFTAGETWVLAGDPTTGSLRNVSRQVGIIGERAWCNNHDTFYFLSSRGLYSVRADGSGLTALSEEKIPEDLTGLSDSACVLDYYHADRGVYIHKTSSPSWFYDTARDQFWAFTSGSNSHVLLGPFQLGQMNFYGRVLHMHGNVAAGSADVTWRIVAGDTAEEAAANGKAAITAALAGGSFASYVSASGTWSAGRAHRAYPRTRAIWCCLWLYSAGSWAYEQASMDVLISGKWR